MRVSFLSLAAALIAITSGAAGALAQTSALPLFTMNLSLGSSGTQVIALQQLLNRDPDTRVASVGPGSPGYESAYFGPLTKAAVIRFQEKYASEVLAPVGLVYGSGHVGLYTRTKLNSFPAITVHASSADFPVAPGADTSSSTPSSISTADSQNQNFKNVNVFFAALDKIAARKHTPAAELAQTKQEVLKVLATSTNFRSEFLKQVGQSSPVADSSINNLVATIRESFTTVFGTPRAEASVSAPFGGALLFVFPCCDGFNLTIEPLPPTYVEELFYTFGTQAYLSYNIPFTTWLLGQYAPGGGLCQTGAFCASHVDAEGIILPMVGSSPK